MSDKRPDKKRVKEGLDILIGEAKAAGEAAASGVEVLGENLKQTLQGALAGRENVVMVRLNKDSLSRLDELVDAGFVSSRSEAAAFLIGEGVKAKSDLFQRISDKIGRIRKAKDELRELLEEPVNQGPEQK